MKIAQQQSDYCTRYGQLAVQNNAGRSDSKTIDPQTLPDPWRWDWEKDPGTNCVFYKKKYVIEERLYSLPNDTQRKFRRETPSHGWHHSSPHSSRERVSQRKSQPGSIVICNCIASLFEDASYETLLLDIMLWCSTMTFRWSLAQNATSTSVRMWNMEDASHEMLVL